MSSDIFLPLSRNAPRFTRQIIKSSELTQRIRASLSIDWYARESGRANLRLMVKRILRKYKSHPTNKNLPLI